MKEHSLNIRGLALLCAVLAAGPLPAAAGVAITISHAWARATVAGQPVGAAYLDIASDHNAALVEMRSDAAASVELHAMSSDGEIMRMRHVEKLPLPAGETVRLAPGGTHLMLLELKRPLRAGESIGIDLVVSDAAGRRRTVHARVPVRTSAPSEALR